MRLHRFYIKERVSGGKVLVENRDLVDQWRKVFRYNIGSQVIVFDGSGSEYRSIISKMTHSEAELDVMEEKEIIPSMRDIWLCLSLIKKDNFELVVQKAVELGVNHVIPVIADRSEKKKLNMDRLNKIIVEATEQSGRGELLKLHDMVPIRELFVSGEIPQEKIFFHPDSPPIQEYLSQKGGDYSHAYFIGPEGGFAEEEIELFKKHEVKGYSFGPNILRAETAAIAGAVLLGM